jgi:hypothetical protein
MGAGLGLVEEKQVDCAGGGLPPQRCQTVAADGNGLSILAALQGVPWPAP